MPTVKLLLDTHTFLWMDAAPAKLSAMAASLIVDPDNLLFVSTASLWEIQIKATLRKLQLRVPLQQIVSEQEQQNGLVVLPIIAAQIYALQQLPSVHNDPFDRLIAAVANIEGATLLSADPVFRLYPVALVW